MKAYVRPRNGSDITSEITLEPIDPRSVRWDQWFQDLSPSQRQYVHEEHDICYGPDADDHEIPELA